MLRHELMKETGILVVMPEGALESDDFAQLSREVDLYLEEAGRLKGLMIYTESFPGWDNLAALISHIKFVKNHHQLIEKVAAVTDSGFLSVLPKVASHFVQAEIKHFPLDEKDAAMQWLATDGT